MTSAEQKRKNNREAQTRYRQRKKLRQARLKENVRQATSRVEHLKRILKQRANKEVSRQSKQAISPIVTKVRLCATDSMPTPSKFFGSATELSQEPVAPGNFGSCDLSPLFPQHATQLNFDFLADWDKDVNDFIHEEKDVADDSGTDLRTQQNAATAHSSQILNSIPSQRSQSLSTVELNAMRYGLDIESVPQESGVNALKNDSGLTFPYSEHLNLPTGSLEYTADLGSNDSPDRTGTNLTTWSGTHSPGLAFNSRQMTVQQFFHALQNVMLLGNNSMASITSCNHSYHSDSRLEPLIGIYPT